MDNDRRRRDAAGVGPYPKERERLVPMSSLDNWHVSKGEPDIRGWDVRTVSGRQLGIVRDLLIDREAGEAVMLDVDLPGSVRNALVPIRVAQIDRAARVVLMDSADVSTLDDTPVIVADSAVRRDVEVRSDAFPPAGEVVVDRGPVVEETVVRRREADPLAAPDVPLGEQDLRNGERRRADRRRIERMGTDL